MSRFISLSVKKSGIEISTSIWIPQLKRMRSICILLLAALSCVRTAGAQTWKWTIEDVDTNAEQTSIIADQDGNLHLVYYVPEDFGALRYAFRSAVDSRWFKMNLDQHLGVFSTGIVLDSKGNPGVCYSPRRLNYAHWDGQKWSVQEVDPGSGLIAYHCSIVFTPDDRPQITWYLESVFALRFAALEDGAWQVRTVEAGSESGKWSSLVLDHNNLPHVAYSSFAGIGQLKYSYFDGKDWVRSILDTPTAADPGARGMGASLLLDSKGNPRISYHDLHSLKYVYFDGIKWVKDVVEELPPYIDWSWKNFRTTQLLDHNGNPHISYESHIGLKHAWWDGKRWHTQLIKSPYGVWFYESSMAMDKHDNLYISFRDPSDGSLKVAIGKPVSVEQTAKSVDKGDPKN